MRPSSSICPTLGNASSPRRFDERCTLSDLIGKTADLQEGNRSLETQKMRLVHEREDVLSECAALEQHHRTLLDAINVAGDRCKINNPMPPPGSLDAVSDTAGLESAMREHRVVEWRVQKKRNYLEALLRSAQDAARSTDQLRLELASYRSATSNSSSNSSANSGGEERNVNDSYETLLLQRTSAQAVKLDRLNRATQRRLSLLAEAETNAARIKELRVFVENAGALIPTLPHADRTCYTRSHSPPTAPLNDGGSQLRVTNVPVGALRSIATESGYPSVRALANACGVRNLEIIVTHQETELRYEGPVTALDHFQDTVERALQKSRAALQRDAGLITVTDTRTLLAIDQAVNDLKSVLS